ncbi:trypsin alpha-3-like [Macrobrachium rosenbergii]|uniref:trypsin alpha-3-like n=1 Tax=Macrobrachium rosenbergii TaxID=79674 RepID=UPI0034D3F779
MALIKLPSTITFPADNKIAPVCLPDPGNAYANMNATVTGWGTTASGGNQTQQLYEVVVPTMTNTKCQQSYGTASITANMICAGLDAGGKDSCQGDSGGPLVTEGNAAQTFMVQIGVVSWGNGCALPNFPGVYARTSCLCQCGQGLVGQFATVHSAFGKMDYVEQQQQEEGMPNMTSCVSGRVIQGRRNAKYDLLCLWQSNTMC